MRWARWSLVLLFVRVGLRIAVAVLAVYWAFVVGLRRGEVEPSRVFEGVAGTRRVVPAFSKSRRLFGSGLNSASIAENAVARESACPARISTDAARPPAKATRAADETAGPARSTTTRTPCEKSIRHSAAAAMRKNATTSRAVPGVGVVIEDLTVAGADFDAYGKGGHISDDEPETR